MAISHNPGENGATEAISHGSSTAPRGCGFILSSGSWLVLNASLSSLALSHCLSLLLGVVPGARAIGVHAIGPALVQVAEEDDVVTEARQPVHPRHLDQERRHVIHESVQRFVDQSAPREVVHRLQLVVDVNLRSHHDETEGVDGTRSNRNEVRVPRLVLFVEQRVDRVRHHARKHHHAHVLDGLLVVLLGVGLDVVLHTIYKIHIDTNVCIAELDEGELALHLDLNRLGHLPGRSSHADTHLEQYQPRHVLAVEHVQRNDNVADEADHHRERREALHGVVLVPELDVVLQSEEREDAVQQNERAGEDQHVDVGRHQRALEHLELLRGLVAQDSAGLNVGLELRRHEEVQQRVVHSLRRVHFVILEVNVTGTAYVRRLLVHQVHVEARNPVLAQLLFLLSRRFGVGADEAHLLAALHRAHSGEWERSYDHMPIEALFEGGKVERRAACCVRLVRDQKDDGV
ncbi:NPL P60 family secreted protein, putative [Babesia ovata]|uniref:NPL P60 family secreted protein, putative n=1 Tax=Babesia ovata TaxID=189622 RepID=A0A2H6KB05_9APIC|nr:NPL P60 family secreted protein, putative [Babesia ovata]GBE60170.1 NPL P60 family secreted protein, putative [Babesia ovata]